MPGASRWPRTSISRSWPAARRTSPAPIWKTCMNEAAILTARAGGREITMPPLEEAVTRVMCRPRKALPQGHGEGSRADRLSRGRTCGGQLLHPRVRQRPRSHDHPPRTGGRLHHVPARRGNQLPHGQLPLRAHWPAAMGGRVAEQLVLGDISTGASSDIKRPRRSPAAWSPNTA